MAYSLVTRLIRRVQYERIHRWDSRMDMVTVLREAAVMYQQLVSNRLDMITVLREAAVMR